MGRSTQAERLIWERADVAYVQYPNVWTARSGSSVYFVGQLISHAEYHVFRDTQNIAVMPSLDDALAAAQDDHDKPSRD